MTNTILVAPQDPERLTAWARMQQQTSGSFSALPPAPTSDLIEVLEDVLIETEKTISLKKSGLDDHYGSLPVDLDECLACEEALKDLQKRFYESEFYTLYLEIFKLNKKVDEL